MGPTLADYARMMFGSRPRRPAQAPRERRTPAEKKRFLFTGPGIEPVEIDAYTKGEARAALKRLLKVNQLPHGVKGRRLTPRTVADSAA